MNLANTSQKKNRGLLSARTGKGLRRPRLRKEGKRPDEEGKANGSSKLRARALNVHSLIAQGNGGPKRGRSFLKVTL